MTETISQTERVAIVLPTYNEAENIESLVREILTQAENERFTVIVVDDNSPDGTSDLVRGMMGAESRIDLVCRSGKLGLGTAYIAGYRRAMELGTELVFSMDADFSHNPCHIPEMLKKTPGHDLVIGSRYVPGGGLKDWPLHRKMLSAIANGLARMILRLDSHDCTSGFRCYRVETLHKIPLDEITSDGYSFLIDLLYRMQRAGARVTESPIIFTDRRGGVSKISKTEIFKALKTLWTLFLSK